MAAVTETVDAVETVIGAEVAIAVETVVDAAATAEIETIEVVTEIAASVRSDPTDRSKTDLIETIAPAKIDLLAKSELPSLN